ncbi:regulator of hemoglobinization and erythroid cell expansion protein [Sarcophilus harrisii]|uniref:Regulator of hemoglobinization and erythroid cell expansion n=1 Tax=Sarcophilus harrisii TaxID=9305 RepID=A0A7N4PLM8_SARHA|nr:regulator of hemoglobinization and erythroid cell expansion protein [Sarcophilus harrisii]XP_031793107.1 regulator of hemoglobinization and erythroid cell expansion protein [Sarcophilus harrisii]
MITTSILSSLQVEFWHVILIEVFNFFLQAILFLVLYILLSRKIANYHGQVVKATRTQAPAPENPKDKNDSPPSKKTGSKMLSVSALTYRDDIIDGDSSGESFDNSENYSPPSSSKMPEDVNYSTMVFPATGYKMTLSSNYYENIKATDDYVNVDPKKSEFNTWDFNRTFSSEPEEYTEVAV